MLRKYCLETGKAWDKGVPFLVFAARDNVQDSLGFSPAALVFGHSQPAQDQELLSADNSPQTNVLDHVTKFRERLQQARAYSKKALKGSQIKMKEQFDRSGAARRFKAGDDFLVLVPCN